MNNDDPENMTDVEQAIFVATFVSREQQRFRTQAYEQAIQTVKQYRTSREQRLKKEQDFWTAVAETDAEMNKADHQWKAGDKALSPNNGWCVLMSRRKDPPAGEPAGDWFNVKWFTGDSGIVNAAYLVEPVVPTTDTEKKIDALRDRIAACRLRDPALALVAKDYQKQIDDLLDQ